MSEFDVNSCLYMTGADMEDCRRCAKEHNMPHEECCLDWCGAFGFCKGCKNGIYKK